MSNPWIHDARESSTTSVSASQFLGSGLPARSAEGISGSSRPPSDVADCYLRARVNFTLIRLQHRDHAFEPPPSP